MYLFLKTSISLDLSVFYNLVLLSKSYDLVLSQCEDDVLRLEISVDDLADVVQVVKSDEALPGNLARQIDWDAFELVLLDDIEQIHAQDFEDEAEVLAVRASVDEGIEQLDYMAVITVELLL